MGGKCVGLPFDLRINRLQSERECIGQVLAAQAKPCADDLDHDCHKRACASENDSKRDKGIETLEHIGSEKERYGRKF